MCLTKEYMVKYWYYFYLPYNCSILFYMVIIIKKLFLIPKT